jgi:AcrR family transcriptional regulator
VPHPGDTRDRILDSAETLFAEKGVAATSLREITRDAEVNLAAVNYHFGSKTGLFEAVLERRLLPLNRERLEALDRLEARNAPESIEIGQILDALLRPAVRLIGVPASKGASFPKLFARVILEPNPEFQQIFRRQFDEIGVRFHDALSRCLPHLPRAELIWRAQFLIGAMAHTICHLGSIRDLCGDADAEPVDIDELVGRLIAFATPGLKAPAPTPSPTGVQGDHP